MQNKKIFVTGANGFIGNNLISYLLKKEHEVYALTRNHLNQPQHSKLHVVKGDLLDPNSYTDEFMMCDIVFHCAGFVSFSADDFDAAWEINVEGTRIIAEIALDGKKRFVHLSACAVLGFSSTDNKLLDETSNPIINKADTYAYTKNESELVIQQLVNKGLDAVIGNFTTVYGEGDNNMNSGSIIRSVKNGMFAIPPGGTSYISIIDLIEGLILLAEKGKVGERYIFNGENLTYSNLIIRIAKTIEAPIPKITIPKFTKSLAIMAAWLLNKLQKNSKKVNLITPSIIKETFGYKYFSAAKAEQELSWKPKVKLEDAVKDAVTYYEKQGLL